MKAAIEILEKYQSELKGYVDYEPIVNKISEVEEALALIKSKIKPIYCEQDNECESQCRTCKMIQQVKEAIK